MSSITLNLPDEILAQLKAAASRRNVAPDTLVGHVLAQQFKGDEPISSGSTIGELIGDDFGKYEGAPDISTNPRHLDDLGA